MKRQDERGVTLIVVAASLLALLGFAAFAIDISAAKNERRLDQGTADAATLAAGVEIIVGGGTDEAAAEVRNYVDTNLGRTLSNQDWDTCLDPDALPVSGVSGAADPTQACISFSRPDADPYTIRVRLPDQATATSFGRALGVTEINTSAFAEVELAGSFPSGAFPSGVFSGASAGDSFCIRTGASPSGSCGTSSTGDFGSFQPYFYGPVSTCTSGNQPAPLAYVIAVGLDHPLGTAASVPGSRINGDDCPQDPGPAFPNRVNSGSGYTSEVATQGLVTGGTYSGVSYEGRLNQQSWSGYGGATVFGEVIENRPLWTFIDTSLALPQSCVDASGGPDGIDDISDPGQVAAFDGARSDMIACLMDSATPDSLFVSDLYESPRLTIVPRYHQSSALGSNSCCYDILGFEVVFIDEIWTANGPQWTCDGGIVNEADYCKHSPGRRGSIDINAAGQQRVDSASAIVLSCDLLPGLESGEEKCRKVETPDGSTSTVFLNLFLTK